VAVLLGRVLEGLSLGGIGRSISCETMNCIALHCFALYVPLAFCRLAPWLERLRLLWDAKAAQGATAGRRGAVAEAFLVLRSAALRRAADAPRRARQLLAASMVVLPVLGGWGV
jgi:hypothetical protein